MSMMRLARMAYRIARSNLGQLTLPYRLTYAVTNRCQSRCNMCNIWQKTTVDELSLAEIENFFSRASYFSWINLTGGEIFQRTDIADVFRLINRYCKNLYLLNFPTNGYQTDDIVAIVDEILKFMRFPRLIVTVSLDGPREVHDQIRNLPGSWERALQTFHKLRHRRSGRFSVFLGYTLQRANLLTFDETLDAARSQIGDLSIDDIHLNVAHISGHYYTNKEFSDIPSALESNPLLARISDLRTRKRFDPVSFLERRYQLLAQKYLATGRVPLSCEAAASSCFVDSCGIVFPCTGFSAPVGALRENGYDLSRIWKGLERMNIRERICAGDCPQCWTPCEAYQTIMAHLIRRTG